MKDYNPNKVPDYLTKTGKSIDITNIPMRDRERLFLDMQSQIELQVDSNLIPDEMKISKKEMDDLLK